MRKCFNELSSARQTEILLDSEKLYDQVVENMVETEKNHIQDQLNSFENTIEFEYGYYVECWVRIKNKSLDNTRDFLSGLIESIESYGTLNENMLALAKKINDKVYVLYCMDYDNKQHSNLEAHINIEVETLLKALSDRISETFEYIQNSENVVSYFHEFYKEERMELRDYHVENDKLYKTLVMQLS